MLSITGLDTTAASTAVKNKIPTADYNKFTKNIVANNIKSEVLVNKSDIVGFINNADLDKKKSGNISNNSRIKSKT